MTPEAYYTTALLQAKTKKKFLGLMSYDDPKMIANITHFNVCPCEVDYGRVVLFKAFFYASIDGCLTDGYGAYIDLVDSGLSFGLFTGGPAVLQRDRIVEGMKKQFERFGIPYRESTRDNIYCYTVGKKSAREVNRDKWLAKYMAKLKKKYPKLFEGDES